MAERRYTDHTTNSKFFVHWDRTASFALKLDAAGFSRALTPVRSMLTNPVFTSNTCAPDSRRKEAPARPTLLPTVFLWTALSRDCHRLHPRVSQAQFPAAFLRYPPQSTPFLLRRRHPAFPVQAHFLPQAFLQGCRPPGIPSATCP